MNFLKFILLSLTLLSSNLYAQYDNGTVIHTENLGNYHPVDDLIVKKPIVVDFDGDYYPDIIMVKEGTSSIPNQLIWFKGDGNGNFSPQTNLLNVDDDYRENEIFYADMNGDGIKDIIFQNTNTEFTVLLNDGQGSISAQINNEVITDVSFGSQSYLKEIADVDGDGDIDGIFWIEKFEQYCNGITGNCLIGYNGGDGIFSNYINLDNNTQGMFLIIETADIEGDGDLDIVCSGYNDACSNSSFISFYENTGSNNFTKKIIESPWTSHIRNLKMIDIDSDGNQELLIEYVVELIICHYENCYTDALHILDYDIQNKEFTNLKAYDSWLHNYFPEESSFGSSKIYDKAFRMQFADQNKDNNIDILSINVPQGKLQWYLGDGNGNFDITETVTFSNEFSNALPVLTVVDMDYDTDLDVFVMLNMDHESTLKVYENLALSPVCSPVLDLADTSLTEGVYQAGVSIISSGNVETGNNVTLKAGNNVDLQNGFEVPLNCTLNINISICN